MAPGLLAALAPAGLVMGPVETVMEPAIAAAPPMPPLLRLMPPLPLPLMPLPLTLRPPPMPAATTDAAATDAANTDVATIDNTAVDPTTDDGKRANGRSNNRTECCDAELAAIMSIPTTDPRGGEGVAPPVNNGVPGGAAPALGGPGAAPVDVAINAVIVSAAQSPWDAIRRAPGVRNVIITGGIIALGKTPIPGEIPGGGPQPAWLRLIPDLRLLNGSAIPPVVPNVIDVRIMNCPIKIENSP